MRSADFWRIQRRGGIFVTRRATSATCSRRGTGRLRVVEQHQRATKQAASVSNFNLIGAAQVGKASLPGMRLAPPASPRLPLWPLDPVPAHGPLLVEIYTGVAARAAGVAAGRSKIRDGAALDTALDGIGLAVRSGCAGRSATTPATRC